MTANAEPITVDFNIQPIYEIASIVPIVLLYSQPGDTDDDRAIAVTARCARALRTSRWRSAGS